MAVVRGWVVRHKIWSGVLTALVLFAVIGILSPNKTPARPSATATTAPPGASPTSPAPASLSPVASSTPTEVTSPPPATSVSPTPATPAAAGTALAQLATLAVKGRAPMTGYSRAQFGPAWPTIDGCDERNDTLRRDLTDITMAGACEVTSGTLVSPYTGTTIGFVRGPNSAAVQIDHVVALGDAWQTGAFAWTPTRREAFANDPAELLAVDAYSNEQKGDGDAATWLPANKAFRCTYVTLQVGVKAKYQLWVTPAEHDAIARILTNCVGAGGTPATTATGPAPPPASTNPAAATTTAPAPAYVTPGAFCSVPGATGVSKTGKPEVCKTTATDPRLRWRAA